MDWVSVGRIDAIKLFTLPFNTDARVVSVLLKFAPSGLVVSSVIRNEYKVCHQWVSDLS